jgi:hypothetical protein
MDMEINRSTNFTRFLFKYKSESSVQMCLHIDNLVTFGLSSAPNNIMLTTKNIKMLV